jgi:hypothetical protein
VDWIDPETYEMAEGHSLAGWMARSGASSEVLEEGRRRLREAPQRIRQYLRVKDDGEDLKFHLPRVVLVAKRID